MAARADLCIVTLGVEDVGRSVAFFEALGWERTASSMEEIAWFRTPHSYLGLFGREALAADALVPVGTPGSFGGITLAINCASEEDVDAVFSMALEAGGRSLKRPERAPWGGYSGYFADPDGHPWEVAFNPGFSIGEDGRLEIP
jgi:uncharacterized glyoxalase superfamily protein PhnB